MNSANNAVPALTKALVGRRVAAYVLDIALLFFVLAPAEYLVQRAIGFMPQTPQAIWHMLLVNMSLPTWLYFIVSDQSARGATLGKRLVGIRVLTTAGDRLSIPGAAGRTAAKLLPWGACARSCLCPLYRPVGGGTHRDRRARRGKPARPGLPRPARHGWTREPARLPCLYAGSPCAIPTLAPVPSISPNCRRSPGPTFSQDHDYGDPRRSRPLPSSPVARIPTRR